MIEEMFDKDITVINKIYDKQIKKNTYRCTNIKGFWSSNIGISINGVDLVKSDGYKCYILKSIEGYKDPKVFTEETTKDSSYEGWTLRNDDYIVKGIISSLSSITDLDSYEHMKITNVAPKDYGSEQMQHFEVSGI